MQVWLEAPTAMYRVSQKKLLIEIKRSDIGDLDTAGLHCRVPLPILISIRNFFWDTLFVNFLGTRGPLTQPLIPVRQSTRSQQFFLLHDIFPLFVFLLLFPSPNIFLLRFSSQKIFFSFLQFSS